MSNEMTPMKKYKTGLDNLKNHTSVHFNLLVLNKAESKSIPYPFQVDGKSETKGVESDFVMILKDKSNSGLSFAFTFDYIGKAPEFQTVVASYKPDSHNENIRSGLPMTLDNFRVNLNLLNKELSNLNNMSVKTIVTTFSNVFLADEPKFDLVVESANKVVTDFLKEKSAELNISEIEKNLAETKLKRKTAEESINQKIITSDVYLEKEKLIKRLEKVNSIIDTKRKRLEKEENLSQLVSDEYKANQLFNRNTSSLNKAVENKINEFPKTIGRKIKPK